MNVASLWTQILKLSMTSGHFLWFPSNFVKSIGGNVLLSIPSLKAKCKINCLLWGLCLIMVSSPTTVKTINLVRAIRVQYHYNTLQIVKKAWNLAQMFINIFPFLREPCPYVMSLLTSVFFRKKIFFSKTQSIIYS